MKILFTHGYFLSEDPKEREIMKPYPPLGILYLSAYLEQNGFPNELFDATFSTIEKLKEHLLSTGPDLVCIYTNLMTKLNVLRIINFIKSDTGLQHTKIILGGPEVRNHKENFLSHGADVIVFGEGEDAMLDLARLFSGNQEPDLLGLPGTAYLDAQGEMIVNADRTLIRDVNALPFPNRGKINLQKYFDAWKEKHGKSMLNLSTMRGCPYSCKWCSRAVYGTSYRRRAAKLVVDEMESLKNKYQFDGIWFVDDVFTINHRWLREFAEEISVRKLNIPYEIITRADRMDEASVKLLKDSGCFRVWIGAESGSQKIIDAMDRRVEVEQVRSMIRLVKSFGMEAGTFIMLGYPGEDEHDIIDTLRHLKNANPNQYTITVAYPIKGTPLYAEVEDRFVAKLPWDSSTDRDIDFRRKYNRRYYDHAINWIYYEMQYHKQDKKILSIKLKLKAWLARGKMWRERTRLQTAAIY